MTETLEILSCGAVTSIGLNAFQTSAAFRARIASFEETIPAVPPQNPLRGARVPARASLKRTHKDWFANLASRSIRELFGYRSVKGRIGLVMTLPERDRKHPACIETDEFLERIESESGQQFHVKSAVGEGGAGVLASLHSAKQLLLAGEVDACVVGGVDSLINDSDVKRLRSAGRMLEPGSPQGLIPGEGAAFLMVALEHRFRAAIARIVGMASALEVDSVLVQRCSQGRAFMSALTSAMQESSMPESSISLRVSSVNGEHYAVWESMFYATRFYRTRRDRLPIWYPASSVGDIGAASGTLAIILAALAIAGGNAPGPYAMCESSSETGLRAACIIGPSDKNPAPPFRPEEGACVYVLRSLTQVP